MWRLFATLYVLIVAFVLVIDFLTSLYVDTFHRDALIEDLSKDSQSWLVILEHFANDINVEDLKKVLVKGNKDSNLPIEVVSASELERLYPQAISSFNEYNQYFLNLDEFEFLYRMKNHEAFLKIGPMETISELEKLETAMEYANWLLLALVIFLWQFNLWRKLVTLETTVAEFGEGNLSARASEKPAVRIGKLNYAFNNMADKTSQLVLKNKELVRAVSHELRAPISRLRCQVDLLDHSDSPYLEDMSKDITELENLVSEILSFSRLDAADSIIRNFKKQELEPVLIDLLNTLKRDFSMDFPLTGNINASARIDSVHFRRAIGNLVQNAARYCKNRVEVSVSVDVNKAQVTVNVDDDGPGIPEKERHRIFEPFARLDESRTRDSGGYGLGLAIVDQIAQLHEGHVEISTSPLGGARFAFVVPIGN